MSLTLKLGMGVYKPTPETLDLYYHYKSIFEQANTIIDLFSGSGHIAIFLANTLNKKLIVAVEIYDVAFKAILANIKKYQAPIVAIKCSVYDISGLYADVIVLNPPYIYSEHCTAISAHQKRNIDGGRDGLDLVYYVIKHAVAQHIIIELGYLDQVTQLTKLSKYTIRFYKHPTLDVYYVCLSKRLKERENNELRKN